MKIIYILWLRQMKRYFRSRSRIFGSLAQPLLFLLALGYGFGPTFAKAGQGNYLEFLTPGVMPLVWDECVSGNVDVVHLHLPNPWADALAALLPSRFPVVATWHSDIVRQRWMLPIYRAIQRNTLRRARRIIVPTAAHLDSSTQLLTSPKIVTIPYGIDTDALQPHNADPRTAERLHGFARGRPIILTVGRHVYYKGYEYLVRALAQMRTSAVLVMIGEGPLTKELMALAKREGVQDRILFLGHVAHPVLIAALHTCQLFTLPSVQRSEAFGLACAEAMACGKPTVVCRLGNGVNTLNLEGVTSLTVPPADTAALASALDALASDPVRCQHMGAAAQRHVYDHYSLAAMARATANLYRSVLQEVGRHP